MIKSAIDHIDYLKQQMRGKYDIVKVVEFGRSASEVGPFYVWKYDENQNEIDSLLAGEATVLTANIANGLKLNAVKFNELEIRFKLTNQTQFDNILNKFELKLTMLSYCHYGCNDRIHSSAFDIATTQSFLRRDGKPASATLSYDKLRNGDYFASPYATWLIQLTNRNKIDQLKSFRNQILELQLTAVSILNMDWIRWKFAANHSNQCNKY